MIRNMKDKVIGKLMLKEKKRQNETINLIASENFVSKEILTLLGSVLTNKYSEGYPDKRYYPGCKNFDEIEKLAQKRALKVFDLNPRKWGVNVQSYSGSPANLEIFLSLINPGDTIMGMGLSSGGHLSHGHKVNVSAKLFKAIQYGLNPKTNLIDYKNLEKLAVKHRPKIIISGASAYPRKIDFKKFGKIAKKIKAFHLADISHIAGLIAAKIHPSPFKFSDVVMTTTHKTLRGPRGAVIFSKKPLDEKIDKIVFPGVQGGPHNNSIGAMAVSFYEALGTEFKNYQKQTVKNAGTLSKELKKSGFEILTGGTDNHLLIVDLKNTDISGFETEKILESAGILATRSALLNDSSPYKPSGLRLGTPAITSRGAKEKEMRIIADFIYRLIVKKEPCGKIKSAVLKLTKKLKKI